MHNEQFLWVEKYRPKTLNDCILPKATRTALETFVSKRNIPNLLLSGGPGVGKTTVAKAMLNQLGCSYMMINGSLDRNIGTLRNDIQNYASTVALQGGRKYIILDEADYLNHESTQPALRSFTEEFSQNCGFILTCNFPNRIIPPLRSRFSLIEFTIPKAEKLEIAKDYIKRAVTILAQENVAFEKEALTPFIMQHFPDFRKTLNELQKYAATGNIDVAILAQKNVENFNILIQLLRAKDFSKVVKWMADNKDMDFPSFCRKFYDNANTHFKGQEIPKLILILADYQFKDAFVADKEINALAMLTEVMLGLE